MKINVAGLSFDPDEIARKLKVAQDHGEYTNAAALVLPGVEAKSVARKSEKNTAQQSLHINIFRQRLMEESIHELSGGGFDAMTANGNSFMVFVKGCNQRSAAGNGILDRWQ